MNFAGLRLDQALPKLLPEYSRARLQTWIKEAWVQVDGAVATPKQKVWGGERITVEVQRSPEELAFKPQAMDLAIAYEDDAILVINKPAGLVVHPAAGNWEGTLLNALLHHVPHAAELPRAGIVHRLDKETSGLLVVAKTMAAQTSLVRQLQARTVKREYRAIVWGQVWQNGTVDAPIGRHPHARTKMAVVRVGGKPAVTHYEVLERFAVHTYLRCRLETGRTHQIRVHMQHMGAPMVGDPLYGMTGILPRQHLTPQLMAALHGFKRQALHAVKLGLLHPVSGEPMEWQAELPEDMKALLEAMRLEETPFGDEPPAEEDHGAWVYAPDDDDEPYEDDDDFE